MQNALIKHAIENVWCAPNQDFQHHIKLARITPNGGVLHGYPLLWDELVVPVTDNKKTYFHFYQVGGLSSVPFDFLPKVNEWINFVDLNQQNNILIDAFLASGAMIPRDYIWVSQIYNNNIVIAIKVDYKIDYGICNRTNLGGVVFNERFTLDNSQVILRFYSNAWFENSDYIKTAIDYKQPLRYVHKQIKNMNDYNSFVNECDVIRNTFGTRGLGVYYLDGFHIPRPIGFSSSYVGKHLSFMWDESFKFQQNFPIRYLPTFISKKNIGVRKYLLVCDNVYDMIDFHDDIDIYIINAKSQKGVCYNRTANFGLEQITHNAYALNADIVEYYIEAHSFLGSIDQCMIKIMVRQGGVKNGLLNQKNRIEEMYLLPYEKIVNTFINVPSLVPEWRAAELENSAYMELLNADSNKISEDLILKAYGYNALTDIFATPLFKLSDNQFQNTAITNIPDETTREGVRSYFCYDESGFLLGYFEDQTTNLNTFLPDSLATKTRMIESFNMSVSKEKLPIWFDTDIEHKDLKQYGFACYLGTKTNTGILEWDDVTDTNLYEYDPGGRNKLPSIKWKWNVIAQENMIPAVLNFKGMNIYEYQYGTDVQLDGCVNITLKAQHVSNVDNIYKPVEIPPGTVDVFVNGYSLIENVDYYMKWPTIVIVNRDFNRLKDAKILVRTYGFANPKTMQPYEPREVGFVKDGMLSVNGHYDVRTNKPLRVIVENKLVNPDTKNYGEYLIGNNHTDGRPYSINDYIIPIENLTTKANTKKLYEECLEIDKRVGDYLTTMLPENKSPTPMVVGSRWVVISPLISSLIYSFKHGYDFDKTVGDNFNNQDVEKYIQPFKWLLEFDPAYHNVDENYFRIEAHAENSVINITQKQYEFLELVIKLHLNDRVDLTNVTAIG